MIQLKQNVAARAPVRLLTSAGVPVTGVAYSAVTATMYFADGTSASVTLSSGVWHETASGGYQLTITPTVLGPVQLVVSATGAADFVGCYDVVADFASDAVTAANAATTAANAASTSSSGAVTAANAAAASAAAALDALTGGWTLDPVANTLTLYAPDNVTVIAKFNCFDASGVPSVLTVYKRTRI